MKNKLIKLGAVASIALPIVSVVACGEKGTVIKPIYFSQDADAEFLSNSQVLTNRHSYFLNHEAEFTLMHPELIEHRHSEYGHIQMHKYIILNKVDPNTDNVLDRMEDIYVEEFDPSQEEMELIISPSGLNNAQRITDVMFFGEHKLVTNADFFNMAGEKRSFGLFIKDGTIYQDQKLTRYGGYTEKYTTIYMTNNNELKFLKNSPHDFSYKGETINFGYKLDVDGTEIDARLLFNDPIADSHTVGSKTGNTFLATSNPIASLKDHEAIISIVNNSYMQNDLDYSAVNAYEVVGQNNGISVVGNKISSYNWNAKLVKKLSVGDKPQLGHSVIFSKTELNINSSSDIKSYFKTTNDFPQELLDAKWALGVNNQIPAFSGNDNANQIIVDGVEPTPTQSIKSYRASSQEKTSVPRTIVGTKNDGTVVMMQFKKNILHTHGFSSAQIQDFARLYGVTNAVSLDGGGSTTSAYNFNGYNELCRTIDAGERSMPIFFGVGGIHE